MRPRILVDGRLPGARRLFAPLGDVEPFEGPAPPRTALRRAEALVVRSVTRVDRALIDAAPRLSFVGTATSGTDHVDRAALAERAIAFAAALGSNAAAVAEYVLAAVVGVLAVPPPGPVGIVGFGHVGRRVHAAFSVLGYQTLVCDPPLAELRARRAALGGGAHAESLARAVPLLPLPDLLARARVVTVHVPRTRAGRHRTVGLLDRVALGRMQPGAALVQTSRAGVVDLAAAVDRGLRLVVDVWPGEPRVPRRLLAACRPALAAATPHVAGATAAAKRRAIRSIQRALARHLRRSLPPDSPPRRAAATLDARGRTLGECLDALVGLRASCRALARAAATSPGARVDLEPLRRRLRPELAEVTIRGAAPGVGAALDAVLRALAPFDDAAGFA